MSGSSWWVIKVVNPDKVIDYIYLGTITDRLILTRERKSAYSWLDKKEAEKTLTKYKDKFSSEGYKFTVEPYRYERVIYG